MLVAAARAVWFVACPIHALQAAAPREPRPSRRAVARAIWSGWSTGRHPGYTLAHPADRPSGNDAALPWMFDDHQSTLLWQAIGSALLWQAIGSADEIRLAADKRETGRALEALGVPVAPILAEIRRGTAPAPNVLALLDDGPVFVKPRRGARAVGAASVRPVGPGLVSIGNARPVGRPLLAAHLTALARRDDVLVQPLLRATPALLDLSEIPPTLRINTVSPVDGPPFVLSTLLRVARPGCDTATGTTGALLVPVRQTDGTLRHGLFYDRPHERYAALPWNGAPLVGRRLPDFDRAIAAVLTSCRAFPGRPAIGWDVVLTDAGPVVLEANTSLSWLGLHIAGLETDVAPVLLKVLAGWIDAQERRRRTIVPVDAVPAP